MSSSDKPIVVVVGITGMLGSKIVDELLNRNEVTVRALVRDISKSKTEQALIDYTSRGVELVQADVTKPDTLDDALVGSTAIISCVSNDPSLIIDGQTNLIRAAERNGNIKRFIPSDFSVDYHKLDLGDNFNLDMRITFFKTMHESTVPYTSVCQGAFTEMLLQSFFSPYDKEENTFNYWGDGKTLLDFTTVQDTAKYTAAIVLDPRFVNKVAFVSGDQANYEQLVALFEKYTNSTMSSKSLGTADELKQFIEEKKKTAQSVYDYLGLQYQYIMVSTKAQLSTPYNNTDFPEIQPQSIADFLSDKF